MTTVLNLERDRVIQISVTKSFTTNCLSSDRSNHLYPASLSSNEREKNPMPDKLNVSCESFSRSPLRLALGGRGGGGGAHANRHWNEHGLSVVSIETKVISSLSGKSNNRLAMVFGKSSDLHRLTFVFFDDSQKEKQRLLSLFCAMPNTLFWLGEMKPIASPALLCKRLREIQNRLSAWSLFSFILVWETEQAEENKKNRSCRNRTRGKM